jgi:hypothetical protein
VGFAVVVEQGGNGLWGVSWVPGLCGSGPALAGRLGERWGFRAVREGVVVFACYARSGPVPLPPGVCGWVVTERGIFG